MYDLFNNAVSSSDQVESFGNNKPYKKIQEVSEAFGFTANICQQEASKAPKTSAR